MGQSKWTSKMGQAAEIDVTGSGPNEDLSTDIDVQD